MKKITAIFLLSILLVFSGCNQKTDNTVITQSPSESNDLSASINTETSTEWPEITENGVNEEITNAKYRHRNLRNNSRRTSSPV